MKKKLFNLHNYVIRRLNKIKQQGYQCIFVKDIHKIPD